MHGRDRFALVTDVSVAAEILAVARRQVLEEGRGLDEQQLIDVLRLPDEALPDLLQLAHEVRMAWCGPEVEVEGIVSLKTGGCPEDCHFCSQSGQFTSPVRSVWLNIPELVQAAKETAATGASEFCIVAAVRGPDERLLDPGEGRHRGDPGRGRHQHRLLAGHAHAGAGRPAGRDGRAPLQPQPRGGQELLPGGRHHALVRGALGDLRDGPRGRHGAVLRRSGRDGRVAGAAGRARRAAGLARPARGPAQLPQPAARVRRSATCR